MKTWRLIGDIADDFPKEKINNSAHPAGIIERGKSVCNFEFCTIAARAEIG